jgi:hypothetical protein
MKMGRIGKHVATCCILVAFACSVQINAIAQTAAGPGAANSPPSQAQIFMNIIGEMFQKNNGTLVCAQDGFTVQSIGDVTLRYLNVVAPTGQASNELVQHALMTLFPCPFGPFRRELVPAKATDLAGVWVFPHASQGLRFPPKSKALPPTAPNPVNCDSIAFYDKGEMRTAVAGGGGACPFQKAADMDSSRATPRVMSWSVISDGRLQVNRSDMKNYIEEWDALKVQQAFEQYQVKFQVGDLVLYLRRTEKNSRNVAQEFRHLQRLN